MNRKGYTSIHFAAMNVDSSVLKHLVENDNFTCFIDSSENRDKITPLRLALKHRLVVNAKVLISKGASPFYKTFFGTRSVLDKNDELKNYVSSQMLLELQHPFCLGPSDFEFQKRKYFRVYPT